MKLFSHYSSISICCCLLFLSGYVHSRDDRSLRTSHPIHITSEDFHFQPSDAESSSVGYPRHLVWEYDLDLQTQEGFSHQEDDTENAWEYLLSLHFSSFQLDPRCSMEIRDKDDELVSALAGRNSFWSDHINGLSAKLILTCHTTIGENEEPDQFKSTIILDEYVVINRNRVQGSEERRRKLQKENDERDLLICRDSELQNARCFEATHPAAFAVSDAVVHMTYAGVDYCTGWMISPGLLMTAAHCLETDEEVMNTVYQFNYISDNCDNDVFSNAETYKASKLEMIDKQADYAIVRMELYPGFKYGYLTMENRLPSVSESVYIPQHPKGRDLEIGIFEQHPAVPTGLCTVKTNGQAAGDATCTLYGSTFTDFVTYCDTEGGSSGAPVIAVDTNLVVGIHHCGSACENFAVPITEIYSQVIGLVSNDIATAVRPVPTEAPTVPSTASNDTVVEPGVSAGSTLVPYELGWALGLFFMATSSIIVSI